jgi:hypothetical protein
MTPTATPHRAPLAPAVTPPPPLPQEVVSRTSSSPCTGVVTLSVTWTSSDVHSSSKKKPPLEECGPSGWG